MGDHDHRVVKVGQGVEGVLLLDFRHLGSKGREIGLIYTLYTLTHLPHPDGCGR
jgi:hypothetical protein